MVEWMLESQSDISNISLMPLTDFVPFSSRADLITCHAFCNSYSVTAVAVVSCALTCLPRILKSEFQFSETDLKLTGRIRIVRSQSSSICKSEVVTYSMLLSTQACVQPNIIDWSGGNGGPGS